MKTEIKNFVFEGKTIKTAKFYKFLKYDDEPFLHLEFTDGTQCYISADYGGYTGKSEDEYRRFIRILDKVDEPIEEFKGA